MPPLGALGVSNLVFAEITDTWSYGGRLALYSYVVDHLNCYHFVANKSQYSKGYNSMTLPRKLPKKRTSAKPKRKAKPANIPWGLITVLLGVVAVGGLAWGAWSLVQSGALEQLTQQAEPVAPSPPTEAEPELPPEPPPEIVTAENFPPPSSPLVVPTGKDYDFTDEMGENLDEIAEQVGPVTMRLPTQPTYAWFAKSSGRQPINGGKRWKYNVHFENGRTTATIYVNIKPWSSPNGPTAAEIAAEELEQIQSWQKLDDPNAIITMERGTFRGIPAFVNSYSGRIGPSTHIEARGITIYGRERYFLSVLCQYGENDKPLDFNSPLGKACWEAVLTAEPIEPAKANDEQ